MIEKKMTVCVDRISYSHLLAIKTECRQLMLFHAINAVAEDTFRSSQICSPEYVIS